MIKLKLETKFYLAGPMAGIAEHNYPAFHDAAKRLRAIGFEVVNPAELEGEQGLEWAWYLKRDIPHLLKCDAVAVLDNWWNSRGARLETQIAAELGMPIIPVETILANFSKKTLFQIILGVVTDFSAPENLEPHSCVGCRVPCTPARS